MNGGQKPNPEAEIANLRTLIAQKDIALTQNEAEIKNLTAQLAESEKTAASFKSLYFKASGLDKYKIPQMPPGTSTN